MTQFLRDQASDSEEVVTPLMLDGTYLSRNFATLGPLDTRLLIRFTNEKTFWKLLEKACDSRVKTFLTKENLSWNRYWVNSVQRQFLPNGLPLMDDSLMELPSTEKTTTSWESFGRLLG